MAWRPHNNLIDGRLDNRTPGKVTGWMCFFRRGQSPLKVTFDLEGDFHEDIRGAELVLTNPEPSDRNEELDREGTYMRGIDPVQRGTVGDITAGLPLGPWTEELAQKLKAQLELMWRASGLSGEQFKAQRDKVDKSYAAKIAAREVYYPYVAYPYVEWYSDSNGRVVLELDPSQIKVVRVEAAPRKDKTDEEMVADRRKRAEAFDAFMSGMVQGLSKANRRAGGDGNVSGTTVS